MFLLQKHVLNLDFLSQKMGCLPSKFSDYRYRRGERLCQKTRWGVMHRAKQFTFEKPWILHLGVDLLVIIYTSFLHTYWQCTDIYIYMLTFRYRQDQYLMIHCILSIGSMVLVYMLTLGYIGGILMGSMLPYIAAPWILWVIVLTA